MLSPRFAGGRWAAWFLILLPLGTLEYLLGERPGWALIAWITPLLWLASFQLARPWVAYGAGVLVLTLIYSTQHAVNLLTGPAFHLTNLTFSATYLLPFLLRRALAGRGRVAARWLLLPLAAVSVEYALALGPNGTWGSVGYSQGSLYLRQLTAWTGIYGITFLLYTVASLLFEAIQQRRAGQRGGRVLALALGLLVVCFGGGWLRVRQQAPARAGVRVLGLTFQDARSWPWFQEVVRGQQLTLGRDSTLIRQRAGAAHRYYLAQTRQYARRYHPQWVIWNEAALVVYRPDYAAFAARNARFAAANGLYLGVTYFLVDQGFPARPGTNHLTIFSPQGWTIYDYAKNKPVEGLEPAVAGRQPPAVFRVGAVAYAGAICADFDYPGLIRRAGAANIVFAPAADWPGIRDLHARMAATRAVENGFALFRITSQGKSSLTTAYGEEVRSQYHFSPTVQAFVATVPVQRVWTPYGAWGDLFAWLCAGALLGLAVGGRWLRTSHFAAGRSQRPNLLLLTFPASMNTSPFLKNIGQYGLLLGCSLCLYTTLMWLTRLDTTYLSIGQYLDIAVLLLPVGLLAAAIHRQRQRAALPAGPRVGVAVGVAVVAELLYRPYLWLNHTYLNPEWFTAVLTLKRTELLAAGRNAATITTELAQLQAAHLRQAGMFSGFWVSALLLPTLVALLTLLFWRSQPRIAT